MFKIICDRCGKEVKRDTTKDRYKVLKVDLCIDCQSELDDFMDKFLCEFHFRCEKCTNNNKPLVCKDCVIKGGKYNNFVCK